MSSEIGVVDDIAVLQYLTNHQWPKGLKEAIVKSMKMSPLHFFLIDDSASMSENDGRVLQRYAENSYQVLQTRRWDELKRSMTFHADLIAISGIQAQFQFLNGPTVDVSSQNSQSAALLKEYLDDGPNGGTPLCSHINSVIAQISARAPELRRKAQKACVTIATDGEASDGDIVAALKPLEDLPCHLVVRLYTDDETVVQYWNEIDKKLELDLDVLVNLENEAKEVFLLNKWLTYGEPLHLAREFGIFVREIDMIDEQVLLLDASRTVAMTILGGDASSYPHPSLDLKGYVSFLQAKNNEEQKVFDVITLSMKPWLKLD